MKSKLHLFVSQLTALCIGEGGKWYKSNKFLRNKMSEIINFKDKFKKFSQLWTPKILGQFDNYQIKAAKMKGEFIWHSHSDADELFIVVDGVLKIHLRDREIELHPGECFIVPKGVEHKTSADKEAHVLFIEKAGTLNTGDQVDSGKKVSEEEWI